MNPQPPEPQSEALTNCATLTMLLNGAPCRIRTRGLRLRRPLLYPAELRARINFSKKRETGFEPATYGLEGHRSSQLSYSRILFSLGIGARRFELPTPCSQSRCANQTALHPGFCVSQGVIIYPTLILSRLPVRVWHVRRVLPVL